ncbi:MAG: hypothetical protein LBQ83_01890 [Candidatus Margulisbacteria bacterium]|jgi:hypothetical protein|nr:hypothetical protein [Candidatus Margulisiibacteriota bacterium]
MSKLFDIGSEIYFTKIVKNNGVLEGVTVSKGTLCGYTLATSGYLLAKILVGVKTDYVEFAHVFVTEKEAGAHAEQILPLIQEGENISGRAQEQIDDLRKKVLGEPPFEALAQKLQQGRG